MIGSISLGINEGHWRTSNSLISPPSPSPNIHSPLQGAKAMDYQYSVGLVIKCEISRPSFSWNSHAMLKSKLFPLVGRGGQSGLKYFLWQFNVRKWRRRSLLQSVRPDNKHAKCLLCKLPSPLLPPPPLYADQSAMAPFYKMLSWNVRQRAAITL